MKTLFLLRHAKSSWALADQRDFDRPLNDRGRAAALLMGREFRRLGLAAERIISSPAARTMETLAQISSGYGARMPVDYRPDLYLASPETLLAHVRAMEENCDSLLIVGHYPGLQQLALLLGAEGPLRREIVAKYPTGGLAEIELPAGRWAEVGEGEGRIVRFLRPRDLEDDD